MDDLSQKLNQILSDPEALSQIQQLSGMMGLGQQQSGNNTEANSSQGGASGQNGGIDLSQILNNPGTMEQLQGLAGMFGGQNTGSQSSAPAPAISPDMLNQFQGLASMLGNSNSQQNSGVDFSGLPIEGIQMISKLMPMLGSMNQDDDTTRLLNALRPFLGETRRKKLDQAEKMMRMMRLLPLLKESNIF